MSDRPDSDDRHSASDPTQGDYVNPNSHNKWFATVMGGQGGKPSETDGVPASFTTHVTVAHPAPSHTYTAAGGRSGQAPLDQQETHLPSYYAPHWNTQHQYYLPESASATLRTHDGMSTEFHSPEGSTRTGETDRCCEISKPGCCRLNPLKISFTTPPPATGEESGSQSGSRGGKKRSPKAKPSVSKSWSVQAKLVSDSTPLMEERADGVTKVNSGVRSSGNPNLRHWQLTESVTQDSAELSAGSGETWRKLLTGPWAETLLHVQGESGPSTDDQQCVAKDDRQEELYPDRVRGERVALVPEDGRKGSLMLTPLSSVPSEAEEFTGSELKYVTANSIADRQLKSAAHELAKARRAAMRDTAEEVERRRADGRAAYLRKAAPWGIGSTR